MGIASHLKNPGVCFLLSFFLSLSPLAGMDSDEDPADLLNNTLLVHKELSETDEDSCSSSCDESTCLLQMEPDVIPPENKPLPRDLWLIIAKYAGDGYGCNLHFIAKDEKVEAHHTPALIKRKDKTYALFVRNKDNSVSNALDPLTWGITIEDLDDLWNNSQESRTLFLGYDDKIMQALLAKGGHTYAHGQLPLVSKELNSYFQWWFPHLILPKKPSVLNVLYSLQAVESSDQRYREFNKDGFEIPYPPAYRTLIKAVTDAESIVGYSLVFRILDGIKRLEELRETYDFESPKNYYGYCSSFARDPATTLLSLAIMTGFTAFTAYKLYVLTHNYPSAYQAALNYTSSEISPETLMDSYIRSRYERGYCDLHSDKCREVNNFFACSNLCKIWEAADFSGGNYFSGSICENPNITDSRFIDLVHNFSTTVQRICEQNVKDFWSQWLRNDLANFMRPMYPRWMRHNKSEYFGRAGLLQTITGENRFVYQRLYDLRNLAIDPSGVSCFMELDLYSYDPVCIAKRMTDPTWTYVKWSSPLIIMYIFYAIIMALGWC